MVSRPRLWALSRIVVRGGRGYREIDKEVRLVFDGLRGSEWLIILVIVALLFGAKKLPELARSIGASAKEFRNGLSQGASDTPDAAKSESDETGS
jgi:sec-independent protein translocase protein TatA